VLRSRGIEVPIEAMRRIEGELDPVRLDRWIRCALTADTIDDVFTNE
jgi:hypothetical protein